MAWATERLRERGIEPISASQQARTWDLSCVLRLHTNEGDAYLKAMPPEYASEATITRLLADLHSDHIAQVLAIDEDRGWMLLRDAGPLMDDGDIAC